MKRLIALALSSLLASALAALPASAQNYPDKPIRIIVPFTPGSATDVTARALAAAMTKNLGQTVIVDNKPGAGGTIGAGQVAKSAPDGYTLLANSSAHTVNPAIYASMTYDTVKDLPGISLLAVQPNIMVASPEKGWKTAADYVKAAKAAPGKLTYATAGTGSGTHMNAERFKLAPCIDTVHVPYKGTPEALGDTMNGRTDIYFCPVIAALPMIRDKRVVALANGSPKRSSVLPELATTEEQGFKDSGYNFWVGLFAPAGTPPAVIAKLNAEVKKALDSPEVKERLAALGTDASPTTPAELDKIVAREAYLQQAQDDATLLAIRDMERAGIDIITDGEMRRESYSNHFATALEGVDVDHPGTALDRSGHPNPVPRIAGPIVRPRPVGVRDVEFLRANTDHTVKMTVPGPFTMSQQAQNDHYPDLASAALAYAAAVNAEIKDLHAAGADLVQIDEPYMQARPEAAREYGLDALNAALDGVTGTTAVHICFGYAAIIHDRPEGYSFLPELAGCSADQISIETAQSGLDLGVLKDLSEKTIILGVIDLSDHEVESVELVADRVRGALAPSE